MERTVQEANGARSERRKERSGDAPCEGERSETSSEYAQLLRTPKKRERRNPVNAHVSSSRRSLSSHLHLTSPVCTSTQHSAFSSSSVTRSSVPVGSKADLAVEKAPVACP